MQLRPYQEAAVTAIENEWGMGRKRTLLVLPTGCGKTVVFSSVVNDRISAGDRVLILAHRGELLDQAADKLKKAFGIDSVLEKAESTAYGSFIPVTVGSVQTLCRDKRLEVYPEDYFGTIVIDEAHHAMSDTYQKVLGHFPKANILGVTATPDRADQKNLGRFFDSKAYEYSMSQAIREHYLCPVKAQMIPLELNISEVSTSSGDYAAGEIGEALEPYLEQIADEMRHYCRDRKTVVFLPLVKTSQKFRGLLSEKGFRAAEVNGNSPDRAEVLADFEAGRYDVLCNSMLLTEGWDCPAVDCVVILRPTKVRSLYQQMVGRGMRLSPGKDHLLLLDFLWLSEKHSLCRPSSLISPNEEISKRIDGKVRDSAAGIDLLEAEEQAQKDVIADRERSLAQQLSDMRTRKRQLVDPLQYAMSIEAEDLAFYTPTFVWEMGPASPKQLEFLEKRGIFPDSVENAGKASMLIDRLVNRQNEGLSTPKQIRLLERYGFRRVGTWKFEDANKLITRIAANGWQIPRGIIASKYIP